MTSPSSPRPPATDRDLPSQQHPAQGQPPALAIHAHPPADRQEQKRPQDRRIERLPQEPAAMFMVIDRVRRNIRRPLKPAVRQPMRKIARAWWSNFRTKMVLLRSDSSVPNRPKLMIRGPMSGTAGLLKSATKPIAKEAMMASVELQRMAKKTRRISSRSGLMSGRTRAQDAHEAGLQDGGNEHQGLQTETNAFNHSRGRPSSTRVRDHCDRRRLHHDHVAEGREIANGSDGDVPHQGVVQVLLALCHFAHDDGDVEKARLSPGRRRCRRLGS